MFGELSLNGLLSFIFIAIAAITALVPVRKTAIKTLAKDPGR